MRKSENCGANLDSGERCDCEMEGREKPLVMVRSMAHMAETGKTRKQKYPGFKVVQKQGGLNQ